MDQPGDTDAYQQVCPALCPCLYVTTETPQKVPALLYIPKGEGPTLS